MVVVVVIIVIIIFYLKYLEMQLMNTTCCFMAHWNVYLPNACRFQPTVQTRFYHMRQDSSVNVNIIECYEFITLQTVLQVFL